jgi:hypothetical protein
MKPNVDRVGKFNTAAQDKLALLKKEMFQREHYQIPKSYVDQIPDLIAKKANHNYQARE